MLFEQDPVHELQRCSGVGGYLVSGRNVVHRLDRGFDGNRFGCDKVVACYDLSEAGAGYSGCFPTVGGCFPCLGSVDGRCPLVPCDDPTTTSPKAPTRERSSPESTSRSSWCLHSRQHLAPVELVGASRCRRRRMIRRLHTPILQHAFDRPGPQYRRFIPARDARRSLRV